MFNWGLLPRKLGLRRFDGFIVTVFLGGLQNIEVNYGKWVSGRDLHIILCDNGV